jgi:glyceraldehyde-3-phosphate dehydrogenase/erythrose-4-phosphate dehydrogenase
MFSFELKPVSAVLTYCKTPMSTISVASCTTTTMTTPAAS